MSFHQCTELFVQLNVLCLGNWLHAPLRKKCEEVLVFSIFHPTRLFRPTQLLIWMNFPPYTIIPHCIAIRHFTVLKNSYLEAYRSQIKCFNPRQARNQGGFGGFVRTPLFANPPSKNTNPPPSNFPTPYLASDSTHECPFLV